MIKTNNTRFYTSPKMKMVEIKARKIVCASGATETSQEGSTDGWY